MSYKRTNQSRSRRRLLSGCRACLVTMTAGSNALLFSWEFGTAIQSNFTFVILSRLLCTLSPTVDLPRDRLGEHGTGGDNAKINFKHGSFSIQVLPHEGQVQVFSMGPPSAYPQHSIQGEVSSSSDRQSSPIGPV